MSTCGYPHPPLPRGDSFCYSAYMEGLKTNSERKLEKKYAELSHNYDRLIHDYVHLKELNDRLQRDFDVISWLNWRYITGERKPKLSTVVNANSEEELVE
jgi:hypothetical protein